MAHLFVIETTYTQPLSAVDKLVEEQRSWLDECCTNGHILAAGRQVPRKGTIWLGTGQSSADVEHFLATSPFVREQVVEYRITEFIPVKTCPELQEFQTDK